MFISITQEMLWYSQWANLILALQKVIFDSCSHCTYGKKTNYGN